MHDRIFPESRPLSRPHGNTSQDSPEICGSLIVWEDYRNGRADIYLYDTGTGVETRVTNNSKNQKDPVVSDGWIAWNDERNGSQIFVFNISSGTETGITGNPALKYQPAISGDRVVWSEYDLDNTNIWIIPSHPASWNN